MIVKNCLRCDGKFEVASNQNAQKFCKKNLNQDCISCGKEFSQECGKDHLEACSTECKKAALKKLRTKSESRSCRDCDSPFEVNPSSQRTRCADCTTVPVGKIRKKCKGCEKSFQAVNNRTLYCRKEITVDCACGISFTDICTQRTRKTCGNSSCLALIQKKNTKISQCLICGESFTGKSNRSCGKTITIECLDCHSPIEDKCRKNQKVFCDSTCAFVYRQKNGEFERSADCELCGQTFITSELSKKFCSLQHSSPCSFCGDPTITKNQNITDNRNVFCAKFCRDLSRLPDAQSALIKIYRDMARDFAEGSSIENLRRDYPEITIDKFFEKLLIEDSTPNLEEIVINFLEEEFSDLSFEKQVRCIRDSVTKGKLEIDILIPELYVGFEVQDFWTHSKNSDTAKFQYGVKRGPSYHEMKRNFAFEQLGITLVDIWEDSIKDGSYKKIVMDSIHAAQQSILVK